MLNLYHNGNEGVAWHSDDEKSLGKNTAIASLSFGAEREFSFKHKQTKQMISLVLEHGSLLIMKNATQTNWLHSPTENKFNFSNDSMLRRNFNRTALDDTRHQSPL